MREPQRDLQWDALRTTSTRLAAKYGQPVQAKERRRFLTVTGGFEALGRFFPVYERRVFDRRWLELRPIGQAAAEVGSLLRGMQDLSEAMETKDHDVADDDRGADDVVELDRRAGERMAELIAGAADHWSAPTPCVGWTVKDLVTHVIAGNVKYEGIARGDDFVPGAPDVDVGADPAETYKATFAAMVDAWRQPGALDREIGLPRGVRGPAEVAAWIHFGETLGHGWDLARATNQDPGFDDDVVATCLAATKQRMPPQRGEESPFADATETNSESLLDQLAAYLGRDL